jgi:hypothetical protein
MPAPVVARQRPPATELPGQAPGTRPPAKRTSARNLDRQAVSPHAETYGPRVLASLGGLTTSATTSAPPRKPKSARRLGRRHCSFRRRCRAPQQLPRHRDAGLTPAKTPHVVRRSRRLSPTQPGRSPSRLRRPSNPLATPWSRQVLRPGTEVPLRRTRGAIAPVSRPRRRGLGRLRGPKPTFRL